jgi:hypothetical protein
VSVAVENKINNRTLAEYARAATEITASIQFSKNKIKMCLPVSANAPESIHDTITHVLYKFLRPVSILFKIMTSPRDGGLEGLASEMCPVLSGEL